MATNIFRQTTRYLIRNSTYSHVLFGSGRLAHNFEISFLGKSRSRQFAQSQRVDPNFCCRHYSHQHRIEDSAGEPTEENNFDIALVAEKEASLGVLLDRTPDRVSTDDYLSVLRILATSSLPDAPLRAERWLNRLEQHAADTSPEKLKASSNIFGNTTSIKGIVIPTSECYQCVIEAWGGAENEDSARAITRAERWLWKNIDSDLALARPNTACFNAFLDVCTKGRALKNSTSGSNIAREHAQKAENVLRFMISMRRKEGPGCLVSPTLESFNFVIRGWTRCRKSFDIAERTMDALHLLEQFQQSVDPNIRPDMKSYGMAMDAISVRAKLKIKRTRGPLGRSNRQNPMENGIEELQLLNNMISHLHERQKAGDSDLAPSTYSYNILLTCWSFAAFIHDHAPAEAEKILRQMTLFKEQGIKGIEPDSSTYLMVMRAWANCNRPNRGSRISWLLSKQWSDFKFSGNANIRPTVDTYNTVISVWIGLMEPLQAEKVLSELVYLTDQESNAKIRPNSESFSLIIRAWLAVAEMGSAEALITAAKWILLVEERERSESGILLNGELFTLFFGVARRCAKSSLNILNTVMNVFEKYRVSRHPVDCIDYARLLQVGLLILSKEKSNQDRSSFIEHVVSDCKQAGLVSNKMLQALSNGPIYADGWTAEESQRIFQYHFPQWPLPDAWTRNVRPIKMLPTENDRVRSIFTLSHHGPDPIT